jgi:hypothetical protein
MFKLRKEIAINETVINGGVIYTIDNFYDNPDEVLNFIMNFKPNLHKSNSYPSYNSIFFEDRRHVIHCQEVAKVYQFLSDMCGQKPLHGYDKIITNVTTFKKNNFNDYHNNYWWPHLDEGYTAIVYLNQDDDCSGTNLYKIINHSEEPPDCAEHYAPWRKKNNFELVYSIEPKYNKMVLFDGSKHVHGMNICDEKYFSKQYRINQVFFFQTK